MRGEGREAGRKTGTCGSRSNWTNRFRNKCQTNEEAKADYDYMKENLSLKKQLAELQQENNFLKKAAAFFAKEID